MNEQIIGTSNMWRFQFYLTLVLLVGTVPMTAGDADFVFNTSLALARRDQQDAPSGVRFSGSGASRHATRHLGGKDSLSSAYGCWRRQANRRLAIDRDWLMGGNAGSDIFVYPISANSAVIPSLTSIPTATGSISLF